MGVNKRVITILHTFWNLWTATETKVAVFFGFLWVCFSALVGGIDTHITGLVILVALDVITGVTSSFKTHSFQSHIMTHGLFKKAAMFLIIGLGVALDMAMGGHTVRTFFISAFAVVETLSIVENIDKLGYGQYIPDFMRRWLAQITVEKKVEDINHVS